MCGYLDAEFTYFLLFLHKIEAQIYKAVGKNNMSGKLLMLEIHI